MTRLLRCTPPLSDRHRRWDGAESSPASSSGEALHARGGLCAMAPSCADFLTGTAEWAPDEAEEKKYKYCEGGVVIGGCPRPSPSFFSLCKHCKDTCAVDWLVARPRGAARIPAGSSERSSRLSGAKTPERYLVRRLTPEGEGVGVGGPYLHTSKLQTGRSRLYLHFGDIPKKIDQIEQNSA